jgi:hypothetical protein
MTPAERVQEITHHAMKTSILVAWERVLCEYGDAVEILYP